MYVRFSFGLRSQGQHGPTALWLQADTCAMRAHASMVFITTSQAHPQSKQAIFNPMQICPNALEVSLDYLLDKANSSKVGLA